MHAIEKIVRQGSICRQGGCNGNGMVAMEKLFNMYFPQFD